MRLAAGLVLLAAGEPAKALPVIGEVFATADEEEMDGNRLDEALEAVARDNGKAAWDAIARLFEAGEIQTFGGFDAVGWCRRLEARGNPAGLKYCRRLLDKADGEFAKYPIPNAPGFSHGAGRERC